MTDGATGIAGSTTRVQYINGPLECYLPDTRRHWRIGDIDDVESGLAERLIANGQFSPAPQPAGDHASPPDAQGAAADPNRAGGGAAPPGGETANGAGGGGAGDTEAKPEPAEADKSAKAAKTSKR